MLEVLSVKNYVLIKNAELHFGPNLNVLTGETGTGKSIIIGALMFLLGAKGNVKEIRSGEDYAEVSAVVRLKDRSKNLQSWLDENEFIVEDDTIVIRRVIRRSGRSSSFICGVPVQISQLAELTNFIFDLIGQNEHQSLLREEQHRELLDQFGKLGRLVSKVENIYCRLIDQQKKLVQSESSIRKSTDQTELLQHAILEINAANIQPNEDEELKKEQIKLSNYAIIFNTTKLLYSQASESQGGLLANLRIFLNDLKKLSQLDKQFIEYCDQVENAFYQIEDITENIRQAQAELQFDSNRLDVISDRLHQINLLKSKYGDSLIAILEFAETSKIKIDRIKNLTISKVELETTIEKLREELLNESSKLTCLRKEVAARLSNKVEEELQGLGMPNAKFFVDIRPLIRDGEAVINRLGADSVKFNLAANKGEELQPIKKVASGGEMSRIMLALKTVFIETEFISTLVFDEIDAGIGGGIALSVGEKLSRIANSKQILCITHVATVAAMANRHIRVFKVDQQGRVVTRSEIVTGENRIDELARMLSGDTQGEVSREHASELLSKYYSPLNNDLDEN